MPSGIFLLTSVKYAQLADGAGGDILVQLSKAQNEMWVERVVEVPLNHFCSIWILGLISICSCSWPESEKPEDGSDLRPQGTIPGARGCCNIGTMLVSKEGGRNHYGNIVPCKVSNCRGTG